MPKKSQEKNSNPSIEVISSQVKKTDLNTYFIFGAIILVLIVGLYAIFSPGDRNSEMGNPACGKIVIAADGPSLANNVAPSLPEARFFLVVDPLTKKLIEAIRNPYRSQQPNPQIVYLIAGQGEEAVIVGSIDQESYNMLMQYGIRVFGGYDGQARKVLSLYRQAKISQATAADLTPAQNTMSAQIPQSVPAQAQAAYTWPGCVYNCPNCKLTMNGQPSGTGSCPMCPRCRAQMIQNNPAPAAAQAAWGTPDLYGMGVMNSLGTGYPYCPNPMLQGGMGQGGAPAAGWGNQNMNQAAFGWGDQPFVCPNCNWRLKCKRQGNSFPNCPNCGSPMASDMANANNGWQWWKDGHLATNMAQLQPQMNQMTNQPNFWQGPESTKFFLCPNCNWRMYAQAGQNEFPQCPNCKQVMARAGAYPQNQNMQNNAAATQVALQAPAIAPPIPTTAMMPHAYRGVCSNCHQIIGAQAGTQNNQGSTRVILGQNQN